MLKQIRSWLFGDTRSGPETIPQKVDTRYMHHPSRALDRKNPLDEINLYDPDLPETTAIGLALMIDKREQYVARGMFEEAHGAGTMILIMWQACKKRRVIDTGWGSI